ncbi:MAG: PQQ-dependent sugar dehydrogenase [Natronomonas sp.]
MNPPDRREFLAAVGAAGSVLAAGCLGDGDEDSTPTPEPDDIDPVDSSYDLAVDHDIETWAAYDPDWDPPMDPPGSTSDYEVETVIENLEVPWDLEFADDGTLFVTERVGRISRYEADELETVAEPDDVIDHASAVDVSEGEGMDWWGGGSEGGLLGIALHPNYPDVPILYAAYTYDAGDEYRNRVVYYDVTDPSEETVVLDGIPGHERIHNGGRLTFGPRNYLWVTTGDANDREASQRTDSLAGKILRLEPDGTVPEDNPGFDEPRIFTYGHRNPQTISFLPDGTPISAEHGETNRDEVHVLSAGENHGWPEAEDGETYPGTSFARPLVNTGPNEGWAPSGGVFYTGDVVGSLSMRLVLGGLISQRCNIVSVYPDSAPEIGGTRYDADWMHPDYDAVAHHLFENELGRIRHVEQAPTGELYAITSNRDGRSDEFPREGDDRLVRIVEG